MNKTAYDLMPFLRDIEEIKASSLSPSQKDQILAEMRYALPDPVFCKPCPDTLAIIASILGVPDDGRPKQPKVKSTKGGTNASKKSPKRQSKLLLDANADRGRQSPAKAVVNKEA